MATLANQMLELEIRLTEDKLKHLKSIHKKNNQVKPSVDSPEKPKWNILKFPLEILDEILDDEDTTH